MRKKKNSDKRERKDQKEAGTGICTYGVPHQKTRKGQGLKKKSGQDEFKMMPKGGGTKNGGRKKKHGIRRCGRKN